MGFDHAGSRNRAAGMIRRWGRPCQLSRGGVTRPCIAGSLEFSPRERGLFEEGAQRVLIAGPLEIEPDHNKDVLIMGGERFRIVAPVKGPRPAGTVIYYDLAVVYQRTNS